MTLSGTTVSEYQQAFSSEKGDQNAVAILAKDTHFVRQSDEEVKKIVQEAWGNRVKASAQQVDSAGVVRQMWRGVGRGWQVEGWYNITEKTVETAYPIP